MACLDRCAVIRNDAIDSAMQGITWLVVPWSAWHIRPHLLRRVDVVAGLERKPGVIAATEMLVNADSDRRGNLLEVETVFGYKDARLNNCCIAKNIVIRPRHGSLLQV